MTEPKTALAGVILESSFVIFKVSMAASNIKTALSRPLGRWESAFMVDTRGSCERTVRGEGREEDSQRGGRPFDMHTPRANRLIW